MTDSLIDGLGIDDETLKLLSQLKGKLPEATSKKIIQTALGLTHSITGEEKKLLADERRLFRMPYYRKKYGDAIKPTLDSMIQNETLDAKFEFSLFQRLKPATLLQMLHQGMQYLCDKEDPTGEYRRFRSKIEIKRLGTCILVRRKSVVDEVDLKPSMVTSEVLDAYGWKADLEKFLDEAEPGTKLMLKNLALDELEIKFVEDQIAISPNVRGAITKNSIKLLKLTDQQMKDLTGT
jgi:hypothetical protein